MIALFPSVAIKFLRMYGKNMAADLLFARFADSLAKVIRDKPELFDQEVAAFVQALETRKLSDQGKAHAISPADLPGLTAVGVQVAQAILAREKNDLMYIERMATSAVPAVRCCAAMALGEFGSVYPEQVVPLAYRLAKDSAWEVREFVANAFDERMTETQGEFVYRLMQQWVQDPDENVRRVPTNALMRYGRRFPDHVLALMASLRHDSSMYVRKNVCFCLGVLGLERHPALGYPSAENPERVLNLMHDWIQDDDEGTRWIVAETLGRSWSKSHSQEALRLLHILAADPRKRVRSVVLASLRTLIKRELEAKNQIQTWFQDDNSLVQELARKVLTPRPSVAS